METRQSNLGSSPAKPESTAQATSNTALARPSGAELGASLASLAGALSTNLVALLDAAVGFANPNNGELVVDIEALVSGALNMTAKSRIPSSPDWVKDWAREQGYLFAFRSSTDTDGLPITFSYSVRERVLQRAIALRDRTMMLEAPELGPRHLLFALAEEAPIS